MSYDTNNIMKDLDVTKPDGASEYGSILDNAMKEVKRIMFYGASVTAVSSYPYTILTTDNTLYCTSAGGTVAAPQLSTVCTTGVEKRIVVINDSSATVTFDPYSTETVGGASTYDVAVGTIAEFLGHGGTDWEVLRDTGKVWDGTAWRSFSATPAANTGVIADGTGDIALGWIPDTLTGKTAASANSLTIQGEASSKNSGDVSFIDTETAITTIDLGTVTAGDRIYALGIFNFTKVTASGWVRFMINKDSGTAIIQAGHDKTELRTAAQTVNVGTNAFIGQLSGPIKVTTGGTLVLRLSGITINPGGTVPANEGQLYVYYNKKQ